MSTNTDVLIAEPSWRGHTVVFAATIANTIRETGLKVTLSVPEPTEQNQRQIDVARELTHEDVDFQTTLRAFSSGFGKVLSKDTEIVADSILGTYEESGARRLVLPTADAMVSMKMGTTPAAQLRAHNPRSVVHQCRLGYGSFGARFAIGREIVRSRMRRCGHHMMALDPLTQQSAISSGIDMGLLHWATVNKRTMTRSQARDLLGIPEQARVIGLLGEHSKRKGSLEVLQAWPKDRSQEATLLLMGTISDPIKEELSRRQDQISTGRIVVHDHFVSREMFQAGFIGSDVITTLYPKHHGISGITVEAAQYERPVLGGDHGANGLIITEHGLGETIDARNPSRLREALLKVSTQDPIVDIERRKNYISMHARERMVESLSSWINL